MDKAPALPPKQKLLLVDDVPANLDVLLQMLEPEGYLVLVATSGEKALKIVAQAQPDLILLDIMMPPGIDGYEVCARLKADDATRDIPVIFLSALDDTEVKVRAFQVGGVDYIAKPFRSEEVVARVTTHLRLRSIQRDLEASNARLVDQLNQREQLLRSVSHELRSPLSRMEIAADLMARREQLQPYLADLREDIKGMDRLLNEILTLVRARGNVEQAREEVDLAALAEALGSQRRHQFEQHGLTLVPELQAVIAQGDRRLLASALGNLLDNAINFTPDGGTVRVETGRDPAGVFVRVQDTGPGIPPAHLASICEPFYRIESSRSRTTGGAGLGLAIAHAVMRSHDGELHIESEVGQGTRAELRFSGSANGG